MPRHTQPSTLKKLKEDGEPKAVISNMYKAAGGSTCTGALSASELPRDYQQVYKVH